VDDDCTAEQLEQMTTEFLTIFNKSPSRLKRKIISLNAAGGPGGNLLNVPALAGLGIETLQQQQQTQQPGAGAGSSSTQQQSSNRSRSRSPSPKRYDSCSVLGKNRPHVKCILGYFHG
jgi:hypothetical protein